MGGRKDDQEKLRMDLVPPDVVKAMAAVLTDGAKRYGDRNWEQGMTWSRPYAALLRHMTNWWEGKNTDKDSGRPHLWHALCCIAFLVAYEKREIGEDDRPALTRQQEIPKQWIEATIKQDQPSLADIVDWNEAPEWAQWAVQEVKGNIWWCKRWDYGYENRIMPIQCIVYKNAPLAHDWQTPLGRPCNKSRNDKPPKAAADFLEQRITELQKRNTELVEEKRKLENKLKVFVHPDTGCM